MGWRGKMTHQPKKETLIKERLKDVRKRSKKPKKSAPSASDEGEQRDGSKREKPKKEKKNKLSEEILEVEGAAGGNSTGSGGGNECKEKMKKKKKSVNRDDISVIPQSQQQPRVAVIANGNGGVCVEKWVQRALDMGVNALRDEYRILAKYTYPDMTMEAFKLNHDAGRNRYQDVPCQDQNRVIIRYPGAFTDYVHANYVGTPVSAKRFICTQGPLDNTITEFWMMTVQENSETIVMLCNCIETGKNKCAQYWPSTVGEVRKVEGVNMDIICKEVRVMHPDEPTVQLTVLEIKFENKENECGKTEEERFVTINGRIGRAEEYRPELLSRIRETSKPIIVHCSAGIGRTGTIVAIEYILERMQAGVECATMGELMKELRNQRAYTIQNDVQYLYIYRVMLCYFLEKHKALYDNILTADNKEKYKKFVEEYNAATATTVTP